MDIFASLTDADLQNKCPAPNDAKITAWKWLRSI